jgi:hypothetical protein
MESCFFFVSEEPFPSKNENDANVMVSIFLHLNQNLKNWYHKQNFMAYK